MVEEGARGGGGADPEKVRRGRHRSSFFLHVFFFFSGLRDGNFIYLFIYFWLCWVFAAAGFL